MIKEASWAYNMLGKDNIVFVDCRFNLKDPNEGQKQYQDNHIPGAIYFDLEKDLSGTVETTGGRHPLPKLGSFMEKVKQAGINNNSTIIAYDNGHPFASRFCWLMKYLGHTKTFILNGGYDQWVQNGFPVEKEIRHNTSGTFQPTIQQHLVIDQDGINKKKYDSNVAMIDSRSYERYMGRFEPIDKKAGHIPGAKNFDWMGLFHENGNWKQKEELEKHFSSLKPYEELIVYCGSGVTATPNVLGLWEAGYSNVKLYVGSWSDWITNPTNPIEP
ncbi:thiosulfate/3-mercaptopyruvate sulfurtransferase [Salirhabdus euzebyi]|uniref:Thiosulfate/3-mercaptopyruvate sulfurtransferase n=1 Tax=Salirhabdus euzebyi TaxID=394506 RepID=A0A841PTF2_9BACI|nr:sulfurtransferase [Salirhabdus euzebyi]MBB6452267.1 thiosulfate/3-mercaptopyruvate sulfurtransferase [Salirhabdus euzebyi]